MDKTLSTLPTAFVVVNLSVGIRFFEDSEVANEFYLSWICVQKIERN